MADMMFTAHDWDNIAHLIRAARGTGISPLIRVQAFPWATGTDRRTVSDAARALALGATAVTVSVGSKEEVQELMGLRDDWHRLIHLRRFNTAEEFPEFNAKTREGTLVVPTVESEGGLRDLDEILAIEGIRLVWLAAGDVTKILGVPFKYDDPKVMRLLENAVKTGERHGAAIMYNMGLDSPDFDAMAESAKRYFDVGFASLAWARWSGICRWPCNTSGARLSGRGDALTLTLPRRERGFSSCSASLYPCLGVQPVGDGLAPAAGAAGQGVLEDADAGAEGGGPGYARG